MWPNVDSFIMYHFQTLHTLHDWICFLDITVVNKLVVLLPLAKLCPIDDLDFINDFMVCYSSHHYATCSSLSVHNIRGVDILQILDCHHYTARAAGPRSCTHIWMKRITDFLLGTYTVLTKQIILKNEEKGKKKKKKK